MATELTDAQVQKILDTFASSQRDLVNQDNLLTKTGDVSIKLANGTTKTVPSWAKMQAGSISAGVRIASGVNLNTLDGTKAGWYFQDHADQALTTLNYPTGHSGGLQVVNTGNYQRSCYQIYYVTDTNQIYFRRYNATSSTGGSWLAWTTLPSAYPAADKTSKSLAEVMKALKARGSGFVRSSPPTGGSINIAGSGFGHASGFYSNVEDTHTLMLASWDSGKVGVVTANNTGLNNGTFKESILYSTLNPPPVGLTAINIPQSASNGKTSYIKLGNIKYPGDSAGALQLLVTGLGDIGVDAGQRATALVCIAPRGFPKASNTASWTTTALTDANINLIMYVKILAGSVDENKFKMGLVPIHDSANAAKILSWDIYFVVNQYQAALKVYPIDIENAAATLIDKPVITATPPQGFVAAKPTKGSIEGLNGGDINGNITSAKDDPASPAARESSNIIQVGFKKWGSDSHVTRGMGQFYIEKDAKSLVDKGDYVGAHAVLSIRGWGHKGAWFIFHDNGQLQTPSGELLYTPSSDRKLKDDIADLDSKIALNNILRMRPRSFVFKDDDSRTPRRGFIAQELETIDPEYVHYENLIRNKIDPEYDSEGNLVKEGYDVTEEVLKLDINPILLDTTISIQALHKEIQALKAELAELKAIK